MIDAKGCRSESQYDDNGNLTRTIDNNAQAELEPKIPWAALRTVLITS